MSKTEPIKVAELFAGVGGFRLALDGYQNPNHPEFAMQPAGNFKTVWVNQWEPPGTYGKQFAARCYEERFGKGSLVNEDINIVLNQYEAKKIDIPDVDMVVGGFPCQDYSVAKTLSQAGGIQGKKGVLWWDIYRFLQQKTPRFILLENVDRLLKSPASQRGRDFAIMLSCLASLNYLVQWRVINSAEYGFSQRRKRVYIFAELNAVDNRIEDVALSGLLAQAFPIKDVKLDSEFALDKDIINLSSSFGINNKVSPFKIGGVMKNYQVLSFVGNEDYKGQHSTLGDVLIPETEVPKTYYIPDDKIGDWKYLKGSKRLERTNKKTGHKYFYSEGSMAFPDLLTNPSRTILTGEGGSGASRFKHIIQTEDGRYRRLVPDELDQLQGFPKGWTNTGMTDTQRAFCMGNALVVGIPHRIGRTMIDYYGLYEPS